MSDDQPITEQDREDSQDREDPPAPEEQAEDPSAKEIAKLRREAAKWRTQVRELEEQKEKAAREAMTENERVIAEAVAEARADEANQWAQRLSKARLAVAAADILADPNDAAVFITDVSPDATDEELHDLVKELANAKPHLAKPESPAAPPISQGERGGTAVPPSGDEWLREALKR